MELMECYGQKGTSGYKQENISRKDDALSVIPSIQAESGKSSHSATPIRCPSLWHGKALKATETVGPIGFVHGQRTTGQCAYLRCRIRRGGTPAEDEMRR